MKDQLLNLIEEQTSPLFRIMSVFNQTEHGRRNFENNIIAFHIGNGFVLSVAHNLKPETGLIKSMTEASYQADIIAHCTPDEVTLLNRCYMLDPATNKRYINITDQNDVKPTIDAFKRINYDTRWITQYQRRICSPVLIVQFQENEFYGDATLNHHFNADNYFHEPAAGAHTYLLSLELQKAWYSEDIALYRIINTDQVIIDKLPVAEISFETLIPQDSLYCIQAAPSSNMGRMINESRIEGILDHHAKVEDRFDGNFLRTGLRYLLKGYFRFGSSGAPYFLYNNEENSFKVNAIQSEACPIQLSIKNDKNGNFQYVNAIASPLQIIQAELEEEINTEANV
ncbi:MAG: hypothetical protein K9J30_10695 [Bacteroidales bacterium]|nr:hypothetical protein [Bacteroidales bacterium]